METKANLLPTIFVIFGATGDLMRTKLAVSLFQLYKKGTLPSLFQIVGFSRQSLPDEDFRILVKEILSGFGEKGEEVDEFVKTLRYQQGLFDELQGYGGLAKMLGMQDDGWSVCSNKLFYLAVPPQYYEGIFRNLAKSGLTKPCSPEEGWTRVIVEKPFGKDLKTAQKLDRLLGKLFREEQIYRIDHYLGKETVQNILAFRFSNSFLRDSWNEDAIESISITLHEKKGIEGRGSFYEGIGALRDVGQNHLLQLLALFLMENPGTFDSASIRERRREILSSLPKMNAFEVSRSAKRGQYEGYLQEKGVESNSQTETYFSINMFLRNKRWKGVPVFLESGKKMAGDKAEVVVTFRHMSPCLCPQGSSHYKNVLRYQIQPQERISISFWVKKPGSEMAIEEKNFTFDYREAFKEHEFTEAYEKLLLSCIKGDQTLFVGTEEIMASWRFIDPILKAWKENAVKLAKY